MKALVLAAEARTAYIRDIPQPVPSSTELLIRVRAIALNPIDPLYVTHPLGSSGRTVGSDFAGVMVEAGCNVPVEASLCVGDEVGGFLQGACSVNDRSGAFAEFVVAPWDLVWRIPKPVTIEQAAGVSLVALTAAQAIWYRLGLQAPFAYDRDQAFQEHPDWRAKHNEADGPCATNVLIYGASTSVALYAAQMVRLSAESSGKAIRLYGVASKARWEFLKTEPYGYNALVDYRDLHWLERIRELTGGVGIHYAFDCISEAIVRSREGGAWKAPNISVEPSYGAVWEGLGEEVQYQGFTVRRSPAARGFAVAFYAWLSACMGSELSSNPIRLMPGGLESVVQDGFQLLGVGGMEERRIVRAEPWMRPVSAEKLVYGI
ncbi:chaperonin 10-like protein [Alternaria rosae]|uniref:chaperonin 10-like protein n=1 Tax=Alternaria rosae TaxID=1187941 RepID=UPI001E8CB8F0|nr:chaperonin 10-like protein [Alternaria rosae]KAH6852864.1 chaperonin 10-like protein [Alternaria rosae]